MKALNLIFALSVSIVLLVGCNNSKSETKTTTDSTVATVAKSDTAAIAYTCTMKCEKDKMYSEAGKCPVCKMELVAMTSAEKEHGHIHSDEAKTAEEKEHGHSHDDKAKTEEEKEHGHSHDDKAKTEEEKEHGHSHDH